MLNLETIIVALVIIAPWIALGLMPVLLFRLIKKQGYKVLSKRVLIPVFILSLLYLILYLIAPGIFYWALVATIYFVLVGGTIKKIKDKAYGWALMWLSVFGVLSAMFLLIQALARVKTLIPFYLLSATAISLLLYGVIKEIKSKNYGWSITWFIILVLLISHFFATLVLNITSDLPVPILAWI